MHRHVLYQSLHEAPKVVLLHLFQVSQDVKSHESTLNSASNWVKVTEAHKMLVQVYKQDAVIRESQSHTIYV